jgi:HSP20 family molecular chaperone IbpA
MNKRKEDAIALIKMIIRELSGNFINLPFIVNYEKPLTDIYIKHNEIIITMETLGVKKEDIKIYTTKRAIKIKKLPFKINPNNTKATYNNGILEIKTKILNA